MLLETFSDKFEYKKLSQEEQAARGILGRLVGIIADTKNPTRNGRAYSEKLWNNVFNDPIMKEKIANRCCFGELGHPTDRTETDMEKIAICLAEQPKKGTDGKLYGVFDILNTKCGQLLKSLCDYGCNIGISSRGEGDLVTDYEGNESVDPETYSCECWDAVLIPAVESARLSYVTESLDRKRYNRTLRESLQKTLNNASDDERKIMKEALDSLHIDLDEQVLQERQFEIRIILRDDNTGKETRSWDVNNRAGAFDYMNANGAVPYTMYYQRYIDGSLNGEQVIARRTTMQDIDDYAKSGRNVHIYVDGEWMPKNENPQDLKDDVNNGHTVITSFGSKITEALNEFELNLITESFDSDKTLCEVFNPSKSKLVETKECTNEECDSVEEKDDIKDESLDINEDENVAVDNNEAMVETLQNTLQANAILEQKVIELQEKLSVCYAKESKNEEEAVKYKTTIQRLAEGSKKANAYQAKVSVLEEKLNEATSKTEKLQKQLTESRERITVAANKNQNLNESMAHKMEQTQKLNESIKALNAQLENAHNESTKINEALEESKKQTNQALSKAKKLSEAYESYKESAEAEKAKLTESIANLEKDMNLQKQDYSQKIEKSKKLVEKYKKATATAVDRYIESQAVRLGSSVNEIKNRLPESYSFDDIDRVCEELQSYNLNMSKLPFTSISRRPVTENIKIKGTSSKNESILPVNGFDDDVDADLMYLAGK